MRLVTLSTIEHDGVIYTQGEIVENINKEDADRLIELEVASSIEDEEKEEKKTPSKKKGTDKKESKE